MLGRCVNFVRDKVLNGVVLVIFVGFFLSDDKPLRLDVIDVVFDVRHGRGFHATLFVVPALNGSDGGSCWMV